jgi:hypothetical protein
MHHNHRGHPNITAGNLCKLMNYLPRENRSARQGKQRIREIWKM